MSGYRLTDEQREALPIYARDVLVFAAVESMLAETVEAARADERATQWEAHKRAAALNGVIQRSTAHLRIALGYRDADADAGLESLAVQAKSRAEAAAEAAERALRERVEAWISDPIRRIWLDPDDADSLRAALQGTEADR